MFHISVSSDKTFLWVPTALTLTLVFDLHIENFNHAYIFSMVCSRILIFRMSVFCDKSFQWLPTGLTLTFMFDLLTENFNLRRIF
jgi:hypothetical protein